MLLEVSLNVGYAQGTGDKNPSALTVTMNCCHGVEYIGTFLGDKADEMFNKLMDTEDDYEKKIL